jgi:threonylcarbamoyladenosine tRNA methylthiotransferase MtaB
VSQAGHEIVSSAAEADVAVFNSCAVTSDAEAELRKVVRRAARERPALRSIVMGCAAALDDERAPALRVGELPTVERVIGGADLPAIAEALNLEPPVGGFTSLVHASTRALLRVQDGCDEHCTFCATTMARGANRSRAIDELVREASRLADAHSEIVITGIHIGTYGRDIGSSLGALMTQLIRALPDTRFRLSSIEATEIDEQLADLLVNAPRHLAPHIHAPLQSGSDRLLKRMGRNWYTTDTYCVALERLAARMSDLGLGADVITGFPGETEADHAATLALVERLPFSYLHVFPFSLRPGTAAERLPEPVPSAVAQRRAAELRAVAGRKAAAYAASRAGGTADVVVVGSGGAREGITGDYLSVRLEDPTLPRGARIAARLTMDDNRLTALSARA